MLLLSAPIAASVFVSAVCLAAGKARTLPGWVTRPGIALAVSLLAGAVWFPLLLLVAWTASLGTALLLQPRLTRQPQTNNAPTPDATQHANPTTHGSRQQAQHGRRSEGLVAGTKFAWLFCRSPDWPAPASPHRP